MADARDAAESTPRPSAPFAEERAAFLEAQRVDRGAANLTIEAYRRDLEQFARWLALSPRRSPSPADLAEYLVYLAEELKMGQASLARKTSALKQFFKFCCLERGLADNPAELLRSPSRERRLPSHLTVEQVTELLAQADQGLPYPALEQRDPELAAALRSRDRAMVYLLYATGLRVSELTGLTAHQLDLKSRYLRVRGKGGKERIAPFAPVAASKLEEYLERHRPRLVHAGSEALFTRPRPSATGAPSVASVALKSEPLTREAFWRILKDLALQAGLPASRISPHKLRHSFATHLLAAGINLRSLQMLLGHSDLSTTQIYAHVTPGHLKSAHRKHHPRGQ
jgi:integrase/recombinase XerD